MLGSMVYVSLAKVVYACMYVCMVYGCVCVCVCVCACVCVCNVVVISGCSYGSYGGDDDDGFTEATYLKNMTFHFKDEQFEE